MTNENQSQDEKPRERPIVEQIPCQRIMPNGTCKGYKFLCGGDHLKCDKYIPAPQERDKMKYQEETNHAR